LPTNVAFALNSRRINRRAGTKFQHLGDPRHRRRGEFFVLIAPKIFSDGTFAETAQFIEQAIARPNISRELLNQIVAIADTATRSPRVMLPICFGLFLTEEKSRCGE
jgi:hypothetical protein